ncbi:MAG: glycosyltransferase family 4 protein, partial [Rhodocyclaceae bacterium]|nr:glycosyltransferase family 4 protein [Rhodocyclaceae bacterium]
MFSYYFTPQYSGAALQAISLARKLREKDVGVFFLTVNHDDLPDTDKVEDFKVYRIKEGKGRFGELLLWKNMLRVLWHQKDEFDIIHSHGAYLKNSFVGPVAKLLRKKSLVKVSLAHNDLQMLGKGKGGWLHKRFISLVDGYISISKEITGEFKAHGFPEEKVREIPNGVDIQKFHPAGIEEKLILRRKAGLPEISPMLLYVGVIDERKNVKWLIESWISFCLNYSGYLVIVGPVSREDKDLSLYNSLKTYEGKLKNKLFFIQYTDRIEDYYKMADIFILPSTNEGMPNVILEAMSTGLACLVNKVSGAEDVINGKNGMLFDAQKPHTFINGLLKLRKESIRYELGKVARENIIRDYSIECIAEKYINLYEEILKG